MNVEQQRNKNWEATPFVTCKPVLYIYIEFSFHFVKQFKLLIECISVYEKGINNM